jgi:hypothetical protein
MLQAALVSIADSEIEGSAEHDFTQNVPRTGWTP